MPAVDALVAWVGDEVEDGLSAAELTRAEATTGVTFPPLWRAVLTRVLPVGERCPDWRLRDDSAVRMTAMPVEGLLFDIEHNGFWWAAWGPAPREIALRLEVARLRLGEVPALVPLRGHWYAGPLDAHPVLSVVQSDLWSPAPSLYALADAADEVTPQPIDFWSELLDRSQSP